MNNGAVHYLFYLLIAVTPVLALLILMVSMDSYRLMRTSAILAALGWGVVTAVACMFLNQVLIDASGLRFPAYSRFVAPPLEEVAKAAYPLYVVRKGKVGFAVDAAIVGFAVGAGFAIVENVYYVYTLPSAPLFVWLVRGFGTAVMHGAAAAIFTVLARVATDKAEYFAYRAALPGLLVAVLLHMLFNRFLLSPPATTTVLIVGIPMVMVSIYRWSEASLRKWLGAGFDADAELLTLIASGGVSETRVGRYLGKLKESFPGEVVADMLCYMRLNLELALRAKGILLAREAGFEIPIASDVEEKLKELSYLSRSIGRSGRMAVSPLLRKSVQDIWQIYMLGGEA